MSSEEHEKYRKAALKQREIDAIKSLGLPYLVPGMSHNAVAVELRRAVKRIEIRERILKSWAQESQAVQQPEPISPAERSARALLAALDSGGEQKQKAEQFLKTAHPRIKEKLRELAGADSEFKTPRSNNRNGF